MSADQVPGTTPDPHALHRATFHLNLTEGGSQMAVVSAGLDGAITTATLRGPASPGEISGNVIHTFSIRDTARIRQTERSVDPEMIRLLHEGRL